MDQHLEPSAPPLRHIDSTAPPSYDEAVGNVPSGTIEQSIPNPAQEEDATKMKVASPPLVTSQPLPQPQTTYNFVQPVEQRASGSSLDCCLCCFACDGTDIADLCYCIFCCCRNLAESDPGGCDCGDTCCGCPEGCCECGGDCDCGDCDCDCGDCTIL